VTFLPNIAKRTAAASPDSPAPMINTSGDEKDDELEGVAGNLKLCPD